MNRKAKIAATLTSSALLAAGAGYLTSQALSAGSSAPPTRTETITLKNGATGPAGPTGPAGKPGGPTGPTGPAGQACSDGFSPGVLVINHPGGHTTIETCLQDAP